MESYLQILKLIPSIHATSSNIFPILKSISKLRALNSLVLELEATEIDDSTAVDLFELFKHKRFTHFEIKLSETAITERGLEIIYLLVSTLSSKCLKSLW